MRADGRAIAWGAVIAIGIAVPPILLYQGLHSADVIGDDSPLALVFYVIAMVGFGTGGFVAGSKRPDAPILHGALAALAAFSTVQLISVARQLVRGDDISLLKIVFNALLAYGLGALGGYVAAVRRAPAA